jgi:hypothetical protein
MARQALRFTKELTPGTFQAAAPPTDQTLIRIDRDGAFTARPTPNRFEVRTADTGNRLAQTGYGTMGTVGRFPTLFYFSQAKLLIPWACNIVADGGGWKPAYTATLDYFVEHEDTGRTLFFQRYLGSSCTTFRLSGNNAGEGVKMNLDFGFVYLAEAVITATDFPMPALSAYNTDAPVTFEMMAGGVSLGGARSSFKAFELNVANVLDVDYDESVYPQAIKWCGRNVNGSLNFRWKTDTDRTNFHNVVTGIAASFAVTNGTTTTTFSHNGQNTISGVDDTTPLASSHYQNVAFMTYMDFTAGTDFSATTTP